MCLMKSDAAVALTDGGVEKVQKMLGSQESVTRQSMFRSVYHMDQALQVRRALFRIAIKITW
jgi:preprotein translocase subunit SecA